MINNSHDKNIHWEHFICLSILNKHHFKEMWRDLQILLDPLVEERSSGVKCSDGDGTTATSAGCSSCDNAVSAGVDAGHGTTRVTLNEIYRNGLIEFKVQFVGICLPPTQGTEVQKPSSFSWVLVQFFLSFSSSFFWGGGIGQNIRFSSPSLWLWSRSSGKPWIRHWGDWLFYIVFRN